MAYETIKTEPAARGLVRYKVRYSEYPDEKTMWIKTAPDTPQSDLDVLVDEFLSIENAELERLEKRRIQMLELDLPVGIRTI